MKKFIFLVAGIAIILSVLSEIGFSGNLQAAEKDKKIKSEDTYQQLNLLAMYLSVSAQVTLPKFQIKTLSKRP